MYLSVCVVCDRRTKDWHRLCRVVLSSSDVVRQFTAACQATHSRDPHVRSADSRSADLTSRVCRNARHAHGTRAHWLPSLPLPLQSTGNIHFSQDRKNADVLLWTELYQHSFSCSEVVSVVDMWAKFTMDEVNFCPHINSFTLNVPQH